MVSLLLRREQDREVTGALADRRGATHRARPEALERRTFVGVRRLDEEVLAVELMVVLGVCDSRLEHLAPVARHGAGRELEDCAGLLDRLATDVVADKTRLACGRAD